MDWQDELDRIVRDAGMLVPGFQEWLKATNYEGVPPGVTGPVQARSLMRSLYARYLAELREAS